MNILCHLKQITQLVSFKINEFCSMILMPFSTIAVQIVRKNYVLENMVYKLCHHFHHQSTHWEITGSSLSHFAGLNPPLAQMTWTYFPFSRTFIFFCFRKITYAFLSTLCLDIRTLAFFLLCVR